MVSESLVGTYLDAQSRESSIVSEEHGVLTQFAHRLQSSSSTNEPSSVDETHQEAQLLMSLMFCSSPSLSEPPECEALSSSDHSCSSDSSWSRKDVFTFTCPSLSLEKPGHASHIAPGRAVAHNKASSRSPDLMGRALTVDDRDAVRLSADAMARNVLHSFQKAMEWRIQAWMETLASSLAQKERSLLQSTGATVSEVRNQLRCTSEARLLLVLHGLCNNITAHSSTVKFDVQPQRVEKADQEPVKKKHCTRRKTDKNAMDVDHKVKHHLELHCQVHLETPAGFAEIEIQAPGTIEGTFSKDDTRPELKAVSLEVSTPILSAMMEKSSRTIVRTCVEQAMKTLQDHDDPVKNQEAVAAVSTNKEDLSFMPKTTQPNQVEMASPLATEASSPSNTTSAAFVTPHNGVVEIYGETTSDKILLPLSEDLDDAKTPRRISPTVGFLRGNSPPCLGPRPTSRVPLISPLAGDTQFHDVPDNGPSLPMLGLMEAACRAESIPDHRK